MTRTLPFFLLGFLLALPALGQDARESTDRSLKGALGDEGLSDEQRGAAFEIVHAFLQGQARLCERREGPRNEDEIDWLVSELLAGRLDEAGIPSRVARSLLGTAHERLTGLVDAATRRNEGEGGLKDALYGSSLAEEEMTPILHELIADAEARGPGLLRRAEEIAAEENAGALPGQEVEPDSAAVVVQHLTEGFEGRGLSQSELERLAEPYLLLIEARRELRDAVRFARR